MNDAQKDPSARARLTVSAAAGIVFGLGLAISGMTDPRRIVGFLDVAGDWDPTLAFVMAGALAVTTTAFRFVLRRPRPVYGCRFDVPARRDVDRPLVAGAALFGVGWAISGFCPGPAIAGLAYGLLPVAVFVASMVAGMGAFELWRMRPGESRGARRKGVGRSAAREGLIVRR